MPRSLFLYMQDILRAGEDILGFTRDKSQVDYESDRLLQLAVERLFEIIGEALTQARKYHPELYYRLEFEQRIIDFRNA